MKEGLVLDDVAIFLAVADCESFVAAARRLGMPQGSVSRRVAALENHIGTSLLYRTTRSFNLTPGGQRLVEACASPLAQVRTALNEIATTSAGVSHTLSIAISPYICPAQFRAWVTDFGLERLDLQLNLTINSNSADFVADDIDSAIQFGTPKQRSQIYLKLYDVAFHLVASDELLRQKPELRRLADPEHLLAHTCATILPITSWRFVSQDGEERQITPTKLAAASNDPWITANAVRLGRGIGFLPEALMDDHMVSIGIPGWTPVVSSVHAVFPQRLRNTQKVKSALESMRRQGTSAQERDTVHAAPKLLEALQVV